MTASAWTDDRIRRLKTLWREGRTADQISRDLQNGISRGAVLGKVRRLGLSADREPPAAGRIAPRPQDPVEKPNPDGRRSLAAASALPQGSGLAGSGVGLAEVQRSQCRWPLGDPRVPGFRLCGCLIVRGAYCEAHAAIAYRPSKDTARSLEQLASLT